MNRRSFVLVGLVAAAALAGAIAGSQRPATSQPAPPAPTPQVTSGAPPIAVLPDRAQPVRAVGAGDTLVVLAQIPGRTDLSLYTVTSSGSIAARSLRLDGAGVWAGLARADDGTIWVGAISTVIAIAPDGSERTFSLPAPTGLLKAPFAGATSPIGPIENGQVTALAVSGQRVYVGRAGAPELTVIDASTGAITTAKLPAGAGDVNDLARGISGEILFTVNHSARIPGVLNDVLGHITPAGTIRIDPVPARSLASNGHRLAVTSGDVGLSDESGAITAHASGAAYDLAAIALRSDDIALVRVAADHAIAFIGPNGTEQRRLSYQVPIGLDPAGKPRTYTARLAFIVTLPSGTYFGLEGLPNVYRAN